MSYVYQFQQLLAARTAAARAAQQLVASDINPSVVTRTCRVQELCESRGGRPGLSVLTSLAVSVDVK